MHIMHIIHKSVKQMRNITDIFLHKSGKWNYFAGQTLNQF